MFKALTGLVKFATTNPMGKAIAKRVTAAAMEYAGDEILEHITRRVPNKSKAITMVTNAVLANEETRNNPAPAPGGSLGRVQIAADMIAGCSIAVQHPDDQRRWLKMLIGESMTALEELGD
ncbi:hypothetical protein [Magnetococcus sp. PR-3]|uniref:hypothetical protein n=1 Tax=Magnetococcus sp. PR-3 TaxID=3120355 RepID=UPI002FCDF9B0